jgi:c-di-GMP-binding flagellar brake protein YcgR
LLYVFATLPAWKLRDFPACQSEVGGTMPYAADLEPVSPRRASRLERRRSHRQVVHMTTYCRSWSPNADDLWWGGRVRDLSAGGVGLLLPHPLSPGTEVEVELIDPLDDLVLVRKATVAHLTVYARNQWLVGCRFVAELSPAEQAQWLP